MKEKDEIDELFRNKLNNKYPYDEGLWTSVESQLKNPKRTNSLWVFNLNSMALFLVLLGCSLIPTDSIKTKTSAKTSTDSINKTTTYLNATPANKTTYKTQLKAKTEKSNSINNNSIVHTNLADSSKEDGKIVAKSSKEATQIGIKESDGLKEQKKPPNSFSILQKGIPESKKIEKRIALSNRYVDLRMTLLTFSSLEAKLTQSPKSTSLESNLNKMQEKFKPNFYYIEVEASRSISLTKKIRSENQDFQDYKNKGENPLFRQSIGINFLTAYKNFSFGLGLHHATYIEKISYSLDEETISYETIYDTNYRLINGGYNSNGNQVLLIKEEINANQVEEKTRSNNQLATQNEFKRIQLPITLGYQKSFGKWMASIQSAFVINYLAESNGLSINKNLSGIDNFNQSEQLKQFMYSQKNQASLGILLNEYLIVGGRFSHEYDLNSYTKTYNSKFQSFNLGIWVQWKPN